MDSALRSALDDVLDSAIAPAAPSVDAEGRFPSEAVDALGKAGFLGLLSAPDVGGGGGTLGNSFRLRSGVTGFGTGIGVFVAIG